jgi:transposase
MPGPYSQDLRDRVASVIAGGSSARAAAKRFNISESTAVRWAQRLSADGHVEARAMGGDRRSRLSAHRVTVLTLVAHKPDLTLAEIRRALSERHGISVGLGTVWRFLAAHGITLKKKVCTPPSSSVLTWPRPATPSSAVNPRSIRNTLSSWMRRQRQPT